MSTLDWKLSQTFNLFHSSHQNLIWLEPLEFSSTRLMGEQMSINKEVVPSYLSHRHFQATYKFLNWWVMTNILIPKPGLPSPPCAGSKVPSEVSSQPLAPAHHSLLSTHAGLLARIPSATAFSLLFVCVHTTFFTWMSPLNFYLLKPTFQALAESTCSMKFPPIPKCFASVLPLILSGSIQYSCCFNVIEAQ